MGGSKLFCPTSSRVDPLMSLAKGPKVVILSAAHGSEPVCACWVLQRLLAHRIDCILQVLEADEDLPKSAKTVILACTNGCLGDPNVLKVLVQAAVRACAVIPVVVQDGFRIPTPAMYERYRQDAEDILPYVE